jgi:hypothetical protein
VSGAQPQRGAEPPDTEERNAQLWANVRRQESSFAAVFAGLLLLLTLYFAGLNAYVLHNAVPRPLRLSLEVPAGARTRGTYRPQLIWQRPATAGLVRPVVEIDGQAVQEGFEATRLVELGRASELRFTIPRTATGGMHEGTLLLTRVSGDESLPATVSAPVSIGVTSGFWRNWFILRDWAFVALIAGALFYLYCVMMYDPPAGSLRVVRLAQSFPYEKNIPLRMRPVAWLLPWRRSVVPLRWIWKRAGVSHKSLAGHIDFVLSMLPILDLPDVRKGKVLKRSCNAPPEAAEPFGPACGMADNIFTCEIDALDRVEIRYLRPGDLSAGRASWRS